MLGTLWAAIVLSSPDRPVFARVFGLRVITDHEEVGMIPAGNILVNIGFGEVMMEVFNGHVEDSIGFGLFKSNFCLRLASPLGTRITPGSFIPFFAPWISKLDQSLSGGESGDTNHSVGMCMR